MINRIEHDNLTAYEQTQLIADPRERLQMVAATPSERIHKFTANVKLAKRLNANHRNLYGAHGRCQFRPEFKAARESEAAAAEVKLLRDLAVGASLEFTSGRETKRVLQLKSISGQRGVYFFRDQHTQDTILCLTAGRLSQCLQQGCARIVRQ